MAKATLNKSGIATKAGEVTVYNYDGETREYIAPSVEFLPVGVGIPANASTDAPGNSKAGYALCRSADLRGWEFVADHRGETVYNTETGEAVQVTVLGDYPAGTTTKAPATPYDSWNGSQWVTDTDAQRDAALKTAEQQRALLLATAQATISLWQTELQLGIISDQDKARLIAWLNYIKALQAVDLSAPEPDWPTVPAKV